VVTSRKISVHKRVVVVVVVLVVQEVPRGVTFILYKVLAPYGRVQLVASKLCSVKGLL
jgi:hypothetical protein